MFTIDQIRELAKNIGPPWQRVLGVASQGGTWCDIYADGEDILDWRRLLVSLGFKVEVRWEADLESGAVLRVDWGD